MKESLQSPHSDSNDVDSDIIQHMRNTQGEGPPRGEDWEEVRSSAVAVKFVVIV